MSFLISRRAYDTSKKTFTNERASVTRFLEATTSGGKTLKHDAWLSRVKSNAGGGDVLIFVHGFNTSQKELLTRTAKIEKGVKAAGFKGAVVAYDWPSDGNVKRYRADRNDAKKIAPHLITDGVIPLSGLSSKTKVHILAHSMGGYLTLRALGDPKVEGLGNWSVDQIMFASADVDQRILEKGLWGSALIKQRAKRFTNYYSGLDTVLDLAGNFIHGGTKRAGRFGLPNAVFSNHIDVYSNEQYSQDVPSSKRSATVSHSWWFDNSKFYKDVAKTMAGIAPDKMSTRKPTNKADWALLS